jgi:hypothetical protein
MQCACGIPAPNLHYCGIRTCGQCEHRDCRTCSSPAARPFEKLNPNTGRRAWTNDIALVQRCSARAHILEVFRQHATGVYAESILGGRSLPYELVLYGLLDLCIRRTRTAGFGQPGHEPTIQALLEELVGEGVLVLEGRGYRAASLERLAERIKAGGELPLVRMDADDPQVDTANTPE